MNERSFSCQSPRFGEYSLANHIHSPAMKNGTPTDLVIAPEVEAIVEDRSLLSSPRPSVDRERLQHHLREALKLLHVNMDDENIVDTPRRWAESLVTMTSGYDYTDVKKLTTLFRKACSAADEQCQNLVSDTRASPGQARHQEPLGTEKRRVRGAFLVSGKCHESVTSGTGACLLQASACAPSCATDLRADSRRARRARCAKADRQLHAKRCSLAFDALNLD